MSVIHTVAGAAIRGCGRPARGADTLDRHVEWVPGVPRLEMGFGVARDVIRVGDPDAPRLATVKTHVDHTLRERLARRDQDELHGTIVDPRRELVFHRTLTPLRHHVARLGLEDLRGQVYLEPHPKELMLLDHVWRRNADSARTWHRPNGVVSAIREYHGQRRSRARPESTLTHGGS